MRGWRTAFSELAASSIVASTVWLVAVAGLGAIDKAPGFVLTAALFLLPHLVGAHLLVGFLVWSVVPDRRDVPAALTLDLLLGAVLWLPGFATWGEPGPPDLTVASWNVQRLWGIGEQTDQALRCVVDTLAPIEPDVVSFLEVSRSDVSALADALDLHCVHAPYHSSGAVEQGGLAVCAAERHHLSGRGLRFVDDEDWHYVSAEIRTSAQRFNVLAVHLWPYRLGAGRSFTRRVAHGQANQSRALLERVERFRDPTIVAGDFNSTRDFHLHRRLRDHLQDTWEVGGLGFGATKFVRDLVPMRIDYVYASDAFQVHRSRVLPAECSDHRPVVSELSLARATNH